MKRFYLAIFVVSFMVSIVPCVVMGQNTGFSAMLKPGIYLPGDDLKDLDTPFYGGIAVAYNFTPHFALEGEIGYFKTEGKESLSSGSLSLQSKAEVKALPYTISAKGIIPVDKWEFYGLGGFGAYFVDAKVNISETVSGVARTVSFSDTDTIFGADLGLGVNYNFTSQLFVGVEGKYLWTNKVKLDDQGDSAKFNLNGFVTTAVIGFRF